MKTYLIEMPDDFDLSDPCKHCPSLENCATSMTINTCPLSTAKQAKLWDKENHWRGDKPVKLYSVEAK